MSVENPAPALRLHVTAHRVVDCEPPYEPDDLPIETAPRIIGSLALAPAPDPQPAPARLELVPAAGGTDLRTEDVFGVVRTNREALPPPGPQAGVLVRAIVEVLTGRRAPAQLVPWMTTEIYEELEVSVAPERGRGWAARLLRLIVTEPADGVAEVTAVVERGRRAIAVALRLEGRDGRWVVTALELP